MRRIVAVSVALALVFVTAGCLLNRYSSDPNERIAQLQPAGTATAPPAALPTGSATNAPPASWSGGANTTTAAAMSDALELRKALAEKKAQLHETQAQFYKLEAQRYALQKALRDLEAQIAADEKGLGAALKEKRSQRPGPPDRKGAAESGPGVPSEKARPTTPQGAVTPPLSSRLWSAVDRLQSFLGVHVINVYTSDPNKRIVELLDNSEDLRQIEQEWEHIWSTDQPSHLRPEKVSGGVE
jgi:hypothetical protein